MIRLTSHARSEPIHSITRRVSQPFVMCWSHLIFTGRVLCVFVDPFLFDFLLRDDAQWDDYTQLSPSPHTLALLRVCLKSNQALHDSIARLTKFIPLFPILLRPNLFSSKTIGFACKLILNSSYPLFCFISYPSSVLITITADHWAKLFFYNSRLVGSCAWVRLVGIFFLSLKMYFLPFAPRVLH